MAKLSIHTDEKKSKISRNIYGNFSEHLGRCIYNGIYVGENSDIPNVNGMRTDIVEALKAISCRCCAGRAAVLRMNTTGKTASAPRRHAKRWSTRTGAVLWRITPSARTNS